MLILEKEQKNLIISGFFISVLLILTFLSIFFLSKESSLFSSKIIIKTKVSNAKNLKIGAAVQLKGIKVGTVEDIVFSDLNEILIFLKVNATYSPWIRQDSYISIQTQGVLGDKFAEILGGTSETPPLENGGTLRTEKESEVDKLLNRGEDIMVSASRILLKVDKMLAQVDDHRINELLTSADSAINSTQKAVERIDEELVGELRETSKALSEIGYRIKNGPGSLHSLIYDPSIHDDLKNILGGAQRNKVLKYFIRESIRSNPQ